MPLYEDGTADLLFNLRRGNGDAALLQSISLSGTGSGNVIQGIGFDFRRGHLYTTHVSGGGGGFWDGETCFVTRHAIWGGRLDQASGTLALGHGAGVGVEHLASGGLRLWASNQVGNGATRFSYNAGAAIGNVQNYVLWPSGWGESMPGISYCQRYLVVRARNTAGTAERCRVFDLSKLITGGAGNYSGDFVYEWDVATAQLSAGSFQGIAALGEQIYMQCGTGSIAQDKTLWVYTLRGEYIDSFVTEVGKTEAAGDGDGNGYEPEGLAWFETGAGLPNLAMAMVSGNPGARTRRIWILGGTDLNVPARGILLQRRDWGTSSGIFKNPGANREILELRARETLTDGAGINLYGRGDSANPGRVRISSRGTSQNFTTVLDDNGHFFPDADNAQNLGGSSKRWKVIYAGTGTINTSDAREKCGIAPIDDELIDVFRSVEPVAFQWKESVAQKADGSARSHMGFVAQHLADALLKRGKDPAAYGIWCADPVWEDEVDSEGETVSRRPVIDPETGEQSVRYGLRYDQFIALIEASNRKRFAEIEARLRAVEEQAAAVLN